MNTKTCDLDNYARTACMSFVWLVGSQSINVNFSTQLNVPAVNFRAAIFVYLEGKWFSTDNRGRPYSLDALVCDISFCPSAFPLDSVGVVPCADPGVYAFPLGRRRESMSFLDPLEGTATSVSVGGVISTFDIDSIPEKILPPP